MGCGGSKPSAQPADVREQSPWKRDQSQVAGKVNVKRKNSVLRMSQNTHEAARALFSEYRQRLSKLQDRGRPETLSYKRKHHRAYYHRRRHNRKVGRR